MPKSLTISDRIKELRKRNNLNQGGFAAKIGATRGNVAQWEAGNNNPSLEFLTKICNVFGVTADWVLFGTVDTGNTEPSLLQISEAMVDLAGKLRMYDLNLRSAIGGTPGTGQQNRTGDNPSRTYTKEPEGDKQISDKTVSDAEVAQALLLKKKRGSKGRKDQGDVS